MVGDLYIILESVFSMDGDVLTKYWLNSFKMQSCVHNIGRGTCTGRMGPTNGVGLAQELGVQGRGNTRVVTFGKTLVLWCGGLGSEIRTYCNFAFYFTLLRYQNVAAMYCCWL
jgi:7-keto-8-aminopelargonate synthetase-like enzyme